MKAFKMIKITEKENLMSFDEIIFLEIVLSRKLIHESLPITIEVGELRGVPGEVYEHTFKCIADGMFTEIHAEEWIESCHCYKFDSFI